MQGYHRSVLLREVLEGLQIRPGSWYLDCTLGDGGHSLEILKKGGKVVGVDVDPQALERVKERFEGVREVGEYKLIKGNFRDIKNLLQPASTAKRGEQTELKDQKFAGAIYDLGVSSLQLETPERGFSFSNEGPLDMRMDPDLGVTALDLINVLSRKELNELFKNLGEEKYSWSLAGALERTRKVAPLTTTKSLADAVVRAVGGVREKIHPATRVFQALRIAVNDELGALEEGLEQVKDLIERRGHILVISFHSLEDRIVKNTFNDWEARNLGQVITKKPIVPKEDEILQNHRSRSAKLRVFEIS